MLLNIGRCCATGFGLLGHQDTQPGWVPCQVFSSMPPGLRMPRVVMADGPGDSPAKHGMVCRRFACKAWHGLQAIRL